MINWMIVKNIPNSEQQIHTKWHKYLHDRGDNFKSMSSDADNLDKHSEKTIMDTNQNVEDHNNITTHSKILQGYYMGDLLRKKRTVLQK